MGETGFETPTHSSGKIDNSEYSAAESAAAGAENGPVDPDLQAVIDAWPALPAAVKAGILAMVRAAKDSA